MQFIERDGKEEGGKILLSPDKPIAILVILVKLLICSINKFTKNTVCLPTLETLVNSYHWTIFYFRKWQIINIWRRRRR